MIAGCIAFLAVVAQINAAGCGCGLTSIVAPNGGSDGGSPFVLFSPGSRATTRNFVAGGKYPVTLRNCGPTPNEHIPVSTSHIQAPVQEKPTIHLPSCIPPPRTICHSCTCYKTILRPRVQQQIITVPTVQRYVETAHKPVVENIQYEALPVNCGFGCSSGVQLVEVGAGASSSLVSVGSGCTCGSQAIEIPSVQFSQIQTAAQPIQSIRIPQVQTVQTPQFGTCCC